MLGKRLNTKCRMFSSRLYVVKVDHIIKYDTMVSRNHGSIYVLSDINHDPMLDKYVVLAEIGHNNPFTMGCVQRIELSICIMDHYFTNLIYLYDYLLLIHTTP